MGPPALARGRRWLDVLGAVRVNLLVGTLYLCAAVWSLVGIVLFPLHPTATTTTTMLFAAAVATPFLHGVLSVLSIALIENYIYFSVQPDWLFLLADFLQGLSFGAALVSYSIDSKQNAALIVVNGVLVCCHALVVYKSASIARDVLKGHRNSITGAPLGKSVRPLTRVGPLGS